MEKPYNPGLSEDAWKKLHKYIAELSIKYASEIQKKKAQTA